MFLYKKTHGSYCSKCYIYNLSIYYYIYIYIFNIILEGRKVLLEVTLYVFILISPLGHCFKVTVNKTKGAW